MRKAIEIKSEVVSEIVEKLQKSSAAVVVDYKGLTVEEVTELRKQNERSWCRLQSIQKYFS